ncbi:MAG: adenylyltransferase/cytidyltransferase family protein [Candidatus Bathyarchaeota archaeon]
MKNGKIVLASGVFDLIHLGHVKFLEEAKKVGGENAKLIVVVARDQTVVKFKGKPPILPENERRMLVEALKPVDLAVLGYEDFNISRVIKEHKPDIIVFGYDQDSVKKEVEKVIKKENLNIRIVQIGKFDFWEASSSSKLKKKLEENI